MTHFFFEPQQFIDEKTNHSGTSILDENGGVAVSLYAASQVEFPTSLKSSGGKHKLNYVRVGDKGSNYRAYMTCCGSQGVNVILPELIAFNRNGIESALAQSECKTCL
jgi:hypothetical protein